MTEDFRIHQGWTEKDTDSRIVETMESGAWSGKSQGIGAPYIRVWDGRSLARAVHEMRPLEKVRYESGYLRKVL